MKLLGVVLTQKIWHWINFEDQLNGFLAAHALFPLIRIVLTSIENFFLLSLKAKSSVSGW